MSFVSDYIIGIILFTIFLYLANYVFAFYSRLKYYPCGPKPLPIFGNCLMLIRHLNRNPYYFFRDLTKIYGDIYTFWFCSKPVVIISSYELAKEACNMVEFSDRCESSISSQINSTILGGHKTFVFMNVNEESKLLRKISADSIRKLLSGSKLDKISQKVVDETINEIHQKEHDKDFDPSEYIDNMFIRILIEVTFGKTIDFHSELIKQVVVFFEKIQKNILTIFMSESFPFIKYFIDTKKHMNVINRTVDLFGKWYKESENRNDNDLSICDFVKLSSNNSRVVNSNNKNYLNESNMIGCLLTMYLGASDTSHYAFKWILLLMAYYPEMQKRMREEIKTNIGCKFPEMEDKENCHFVMAFICEALRFRHVLPISVFHRTSRDTKIANMAIPKGTTILINQFSIFGDQRYWENPDCFNPQRFLDGEQRLNSSKISAFIPFGTGKRMCIGDKFAMNMLFLALSRLLQSTDGYDLILSNKHHIDLEPKKFGYLLEPKLFEVRFAHQ